MKVMSAVNEINTFSCTIGLKTVVSAECLVVESQEEKSKLESEEENEVVDRKKKIKEQNRK